MYTIYDYIKYYGDYSIKEINWNMIDDLLCAILVYLPIRPFECRKNMKELKKYCQNNLERTVSFAAPHAIELLNLIENTKRYKDMEVNKFQKKRNEIVQFGAATFRIGDKTIVSFEGTDGTVIGWLENFRLCYNYLTWTQKEASDYLKETILKTDKNIDVVGHSKGGNSAMASVMEVGLNIFERIDKVYNFDGPGFRLQEYNSLKFKLLQKKLINIVPSISVIGVLLCNSKYEVIKSTSKSFVAHDPVTWNIFGEFFQRDEMSMLSNKLHQTSVKGLEDLDSEMLKETIETLIDSMPKEYDAKFVINFNDLISLIKNHKNIDSRISQYLILIINTLMEALADKNNK